MNDTLHDTELDAQRQRQTTEQAAAANTFAGDVKWLMTSPRGRRFVWWLLGVCGIYRPSFNNSGSVTAFNEGQRNVGLAVLTALTENCHGSYLTMLEEQQKAK